MIKTLCTVELSIFLYLKKKATDYMFPTFVALGLRGNFENNIHLFNHVLNPWSSAKLSIIFPILK